MAAHNFTSVVDAELFLSDEAKEEGWEVDHSKNDDKPYFYNMSQGILQWSSPSSDVKNNRIQRRSMYYASPMIGFPEDVFPIQLSGTLYAVVQDYVTDIVIHLCYYLPPSNGKGMRIKRRGITLTLENWFKLVGAVNEIDGAIEKKAQNIKRRKAICNMK